MKSAVSSGRFAKPLYSTEEPDTKCKSVINDDDDTSQPAAQNIDDPSPLASTMPPAACRSGGSVDRGRGLDMTLPVSRRPSSSTPSHRSRLGRHHPQTQEKRQDYKALRMLSAILLAFVVTWSPYNLFTVIRTFCTNFCINPSIYAAGKSSSCTPFTVQSDVELVCSFWTWKVGPKKLLWLLLLLLSVL